METGRLRDVFRTLERLVQERIVSSYALVGAMAAIFYAEAIRTFDLDVAVSLPATPGAILSLAPLYDRLRQDGFEPDREHVRIYGVPVQFLSSDPPLWSDAVASARRFDYEGVSVRVAPPEHLILMALEAPSPRRRERAALLLESGAVDRTRLAELSLRFAIPLPESLRA
jgi:hypothetical protein